MQVLAVNPAARPDGSNSVAVTFGVPISPKKLEKQGQEVTLNFNLPGQAPSTYENRVIIFFTIGEWEKLEVKPTFGQEYHLQSSKKGFEIRKV